MLTITTINYIRELYFSKGKSYSEIQKMTDKNYRTIRKYIQMEDFNEYHLVSERAKKSDAVLPIIRKWLKEDQSRHLKQRHTAKRIFDRLSNEYPELLQVKERTIRHIVKEEKRKIFGSKETFLRLEHPGGEAQVDFGTFKAYEHDVLKDFHELILSFPKSNAGFACVTRSQTREALLEGLQSLFKYIGYVPSDLWFDQMSSAALRVKDEKGKIKTAAPVVRFSNHYAFRIKYCNPYSGHEKGNVENKVGTIRRNIFVPEPVIDDLQAYNVKVLDECEKLNKVDHYLLKVPKRVLFEEEKSLMTPFNQIPFETARYETRKVNKYGLIQFSGCRYSAKPKYVSESVTLRIMANEIEILSKDLSKVISVHPRLFGKNLESIHHIDFIDVLRTRPNALKYSGLYGLLSESWQGYLGSIEKKDFAQAFKVLKHMLIEDDLDYADDVLRETLKHDSVSPEAIAVTYRRFKENKALYGMVAQLPTDLPPYEHNLGQYDVFINGGR